MSQESQSLMVLILVGFIASGKSTFAIGLQESMPEIWRRCNQDELGNRRAVEEHTRMWLSQGKNVVIDRTNIDETQRAHWIRIAREFGAQVGVVVFETPLEVCQARLEKRVSHPTIDSLEKGLEVQARFVESYRPPVEQEGWDRLITLPLDQQVEAYDLDKLNAILDKLNKSELNPMRNTASAPGGGEGRGWRGIDRGWQSPRGRGVGGGWNPRGWGAGTGWNVRDRGNTGGWRARSPRGQWGDGRGRGGNCET